MNIIKSFTPAVIAVALSFTALPAAAQGNRRDDRGRAAARSTAPREAGRQSAAPARAVPRQDAARGSRPRDYAVPYAAPRRTPPPAYSRSEPRYRSEPRDMHRGYYPAPRPYYHAIAPYRPHYFARPYYAFRPHLDLGFGLWLGFAVPYPSAWVTAYPPPVYGYYQGGIGIVPGARAYGGVSFDVAPSDAAIYLDGAYIGFARDFAPNAVPLTVVPGPHEIVVQAEGYQPITWQVNIVAGQVIPLRGGLRPY